MRIFGQLMFFFFTHLVVCVWIARVVFAQLVQVSLCFDIVCCFCSSLLYGMCWVVFDGLSAGWLAGCFFANQGSGKPCIRLLFVNEANGLDKAVAELSSDKSGVETELAAVNEYIVLEARLFSIF